MNRWTGFLALLITGFLYGTVGIFIRYLSSYLTGPQQIFYSNLTIISLISFYILFFKRNNLQISEKKMVALYGLFYGFGGSFYTLSILSTKVATTVFGINTGALTSSLIIGLAFFHEKFTLRKRLTLFLAFIGLFIFTYPLSLNSVDMGLLFGLIGGLMAVSANSIGKQLGERVSREVLVIARCAGIGLGGLILIAVNSESFLPAFSMQSVLLILLLAFVLITASFAILKGFQNFDLNLGSIVISSELIFASIFAALFFKEYPKTFEILGGLFILAAIVAANISLGNQKTSK